MKTTFMQSGVIKNKTKLFCQFVLEINVYNFEKKLFSSELKTFKPRKITISSTDKSFKAQGYRDSGHLKLRLQSL